MTHQRTNKEPSPSARLGIIMGGEFCEVGRMQLDQLSRRLVPLCACQPGV
jgi:hypothetical protein